MTHICVSKLTIISLDNGLSPGRRQAIIWTNAWILSIGLFGTNFGEILNENQTISLKYMHLKMSSVKSRPFCLGFNVLTLVFPRDLSRCCRPFLMTSSIQRTKSYICLDTRENTSSLMVSTVPGDDLAPSGRVVVITIWAGWWIHKFPNPLDAGV